MGTKLFILALSISLVCVSLSSAKETFYSALESKESVEKEGGTVKAGQFVPAKFGNGFLGDKDGDLISFPTAGRFTNLKAGTIEFWVKMGVDVPTFARESFWFYTYKLPSDAIFVALDGKLSKPPLVRISIKSAGKWYLAKSPGLSWRKGEIHHVAGMWGPAGLKLYLDGEEVGSDGFTGGPTLMPDSFGINNTDNQASTFYTECVVDELRISDHQKASDELVMEPTTSVQPSSKVATTWGTLKGMY